MKGFVFIYGSEIILRFMADRAFKASIFGTPPQALKDYGLDGASLAGRILR